MFKKMRIKSNLRLLQEGNLQGKMMAARYLGEVGERGMVGVFIERLRSSYDQVRFEAACVLGEFRDTRAINPLIDVLADPNGNVRLHAAKALEKLGEYQWITFIYGDDKDFEQLGKCEDPRIFDLLTRILRNRTLRGRSAAAKALGDLGDARVVPILVYCLREPDLNLRKNAAESLGKLGVDNDSVKTGLIHLLKDTDFQVRMTAAQSLGQLNVYPAKEYISDLLVDMTNIVRQTASVVLAQLGEPQWQEWVKGDREDFIRLAQSGNPEAIDVLFKAMQSPHPELRLLAAHTIVHYCEPPAVKSLEKYSQFFLSALNNDNPNIRLLTIEILGGAGIEESITPLIHTLVENNDNIRLAAAKALRQLGQEQWVSYIKGDDQDIKRLVESGDQQIIAPISKIFPEMEASMQKDTVETLGVIKDPAIVDMLLIAMEKFEDTSRIKVMELLARQGDPRAALPIMEKIDRLNTKELKTALETLGDLNNNDAVEILVPELTNPDPEIRKTAAHSLARLKENQWQEWVKGDKDDFIRLRRSGEPEAENLVNKMIEPLKETLKEGDIDARIQAIKQMGQLGDDKTIAPLVRAIQDKNQKIRSTAVKALELGNIEIKPLARQLIDSFVYTEQKSTGWKEAVEVIKVLGTDNFIEFFEGMIKKDYSEKAVTAARFLEKIDDPVCIPALIKALEHNHSDTLIAAASSLGRLGDSRAVEPLIKIKFDFREDVRAAIAEALGNIGEPKTISVLMDFLADPEANVRKAAAKALEKMGEPQWKQLIKGNKSDFERLGSSGDQRFIKSFFQLLGDENTDKRKMAAMGLAKLDDPKWAECIRGNDQDFTRIGATKDPRVFDLLVRVLKNSNLSYTIDAAAQGLVKLGDTRAKGPLAKILKKKDIDIRIAGASALCEMGDPRGFEPLLNALRYSSSDFYAMSTRKNAAKRLISLYRREKLTKEQKEKLNNSRSIIRKEHSETVHTRSSDCTDSWHEDNGGIGLDF